MPRAGDESQEFQLETRHLAFLIFVVMALCVASFFLGRWVERQSIGPALPGSASGSPGAAGEIEEMGDVGEDLTFFDTLKSAEPAPLEAPPGEAPPPVGDPRPVAPRPSMAATASGSSTPSASRAPSGRRSTGEGVMIQVFASKDRSAADALRKRLRAKGYTALIVSEKGAWKVRVGPYADREEAERVAAILRQQESVTTWIP